MPAHALPRPARTVASTSHVIRENAAIYRAAKILERRWREQDGSTNLESVDLAKGFFQLMLSAHQVEHFVLGTLDARRRLINYHILHTGTVDGCNVAPREIARRALLDNACAVVLAHNHPSGNPTPSYADIDLTRNVVSVVEPLGIEVTDHIVVGSGGAVSMRESGLLLFGKCGADERERLEEDYLQRQIKRCAAARKGAQTRRRHRLAAAEATP